MELYAIILLSILFELATAVLRLVFRLRSAQWQQSLGLPRIHHGYVGIVLLLVSYGVYEVPEIGIVLWIVGWALIISDLVHHYVVLPLLRFTKTDIGMQWYGTTTNSLVRKTIVATGGMLAVAALSLATNSLWLAALSFVLIYISEDLDTLLPKFGISPRVTQYF